MLAALLLSVSAFAAPAPVRVDLYVMSLCPFGVKAENALIPAIRSLDGKASLELHFIARETSGEDGKRRFSSLHGEAEVQEDIRQVCARELFPQKYLDYILERNKDYKSADWEAPARAAGLDPAKLAACAAGEQGRALLRKDLAAGAARAATGSPTIDIDGKQYDGARTQGRSTSAICAALKAKGAALPKACDAAAALAAAETEGGGGGGCGEGGQGQGAPPPEFDIHVVTEESCAFCQPTLATNLKRLHPGARITVVDAVSEKGRELIRKHGAAALPLYVIDRGVELDPNFSRLLPVAYFRSRDQYLIRTGPTNFYPSVQLGRGRSPRHLDVFVDPLSAASARGEAELVSYLVGRAGELKDLTFSFHFLVSEELTDAGSRRKEDGRASLAELGGGPGPLTGPAGPAGVEESRRQACLFQHAGIGTFFNYLACRNEDLQDPRRSERCLPAVEKAKACASGKEGEALLRRDARLARELGVDREPVLLWEDRYGPFGFGEVDWRALLRGPAAGRSGDAR